MQTAFHMWDEKFFNVNSQGNEKIKFLPQETYDFQILGSKTLIIVGYDFVYEDIKNSVFRS